MSHRQSIKRKNIKVIILAGSYDFGRFPMASRLPTALWPVMDKPVLEHLLQQLSKQGIKQFVICSNGDGSMLTESIHNDNHLELKFLDEQLPSGTAGCIRDAIDSETDELLMVFPASIVSPPKIDVLMNARHDGQSDLTVMFNPGRGNGKMQGEVAGIYICDSSILKYIPEEGYFDIKEGLIPKLLRAGKTVHTAILPSYVGNFRDWQGYLYAITNYLENTPRLNLDSKLRKWDDSRAVWIGLDTSVALSARIVGPAVIMDGAQISDNAIIIGPTVVGRNVRIGRNAVVVNSILWDVARVGPNCEIQRCLIDYNAIVRANTTLEEKAVQFTQQERRKGVVTEASIDTNKSTNGLWYVLQQQFSKRNAELLDWIKSQKRKIFPWFLGGIVMIAFLWSYWPGLVSLWNTWQRSDEYSSGFLVPFLAIYILWLKYHDIAHSPLKPSVWGLCAFIAAQGFRMFGLYLGYSAAENLSVVLSVAALVLLLFGWQLFRKVATLLLFLCLMLPLPNRVQAAIALPLQSWATSSAVFCLEIMGYSVIPEGNVIHIGQTRIAVAEACNGLRMITAFFVISGLIVLMVKRTWWEKLIILASSLPIALLCNTAQVGGQAA